MNAPQNDDLEIAHQHQYEAYLKTRNISSIPQYISSLQRGSRLLHCPISPSLLPSEHAVEEVVRRLQTGNFKDAKFPMVKTALRRYAEMVTRDFPKRFQPLPFDQGQDVPRDELPERLRMQVSRLIRDTKLSREVKAIHDNTCQICGYRLELSTETTYAEGHHLQPLGQEHSGPDVKENIICVCPNCHAKLDFRSFRITPGMLRLKDGHTVAQRFIDYHNNQVDHGLEAATDSGNRR